MKYETHSSPSPLLFSLQTKHKASLKMKIPLLTSWLHSLFIFAFIQKNYCTNTSFAVSQCDDDHKSQLLELRTSLKFNPTVFSKLATWDPTTDCCLWSGITCNPSNGQVTALDLSFEGIWGGIHNSSSLFQMLSLRSLNLAYNFNLNETIPLELAKLSNLTYLNLSYVGYIGKMKNPNLAAIIPNLTNLRELYLDEVDISANGEDWWGPLSSSVPCLQVLSMPNCNLNGEIPPSVAKLHSLSVIILDGNNLSGPVPKVLATLKNLTTLRLSNCELSGTFPRKTFQSPILTIVDLSDNGMLRGALPDFPPNGSLQSLQLQGTSFSGILPNSIGNLKRLQKVDLSSCRFYGIIPSSIGNLNQLEYLDLHGNNFSGLIPSFSLMRNITFLSLSLNNLNGSITSTNWGGLLNLESLELESNSLSASVPVSLFTLPLLQEIYMGNNKFSGLLNEFHPIHSSVLKTLNLNGNNLEGTIPKSLFKLRSLLSMDLAGNKFNGSLELNEILHTLLNLTYLDLSDNCLSIDGNGNHVITNASYPQLNSLRLGSCNLNALPQFLKTQARLRILDLPNNRIQGAVPRWIWNIGHSLFYLNLSGNDFNDLEQPIPYVTSLLILDIHSNNLHGKLPFIPSPDGAIGYLDWSNNNFTSIDPNFGLNLSFAVHISIAKNNIYGRIPQLLCNATKLEILDLGNNQLEGTMPDCLIAMIPNLGVLNFGGNNIGGTIPAKFGKGCRLETLNLNANVLQGQIPRSLADCKKLQVLDLGNNQLKGTFPCELTAMSELQVLILKSNKFSGPIACPGKDSIWPSLQILDLSSNHFSGELPAHVFPKWRLMITGTKEQQSKSDRLQYYSKAAGVYYQDTIMLTFKNNEYQLQKILKILTSIDLSNNNFHGEVPKELGILNALIVLNLSHNSLSGIIPKSLGNLSQLESLDLSYNVLSGKIPQEFVKLNFLEYLNLSFNRLVGPIPRSTQLQSFDASSYQGNQGLYGPPLKPRDAPGSIPLKPQDGAQWSEMEWMLRGAGVGFPVGLTIFIGPLLYIKKWRQWYCKHLARLAMKILGREDQPRRRGRSRNRRLQQQRY